MTDHIGIYTADHVVEVLRLKCHGVGNQTEFAKDNGFTPSTLSQIINGITPMTDRVAKSVGYRKKIVWVKE